MPVTSISAVPATSERTCWRCDAPRSSALVCAACGAPQPLAADADAFDVLGVQRRLVVDRADVERRYLDAARAVHPDRHQTADERVRALSVAASAAVNRAARTLRDPIELGRLWLGLHGEALGRDNNAVPPALAETVFETQELLDEFRAGAATRDGVSRTHDELAARLDGLVRELESRYADWDAADASAPPVLAELKRRLSEIAYLGTLVDDVDEALGV